MIPVLTVRQPWASAFFERTAPKDVENRTWLTGYRGRIAIHAGQTIDEGGLEFLGARFDERDLGVVLGTVQLVDCHLAGPESCAEWECQANPWAFFAPPQGLPDGRRIVHWMVAHPRQFATPIRARGHQQLWHPDDSLAYLIEHGEVLL